MSQARSGGSPLRVVLVDDHAVVREGYRRLLEGTGDIVVIAEAANGEDAYRLICEHKPDVADGFFRVQSGHLKIVGVRYVQEGRG